MKKSNENILIKGLLHELSPDEEPLFQQLLEEKPEAVLFATNYVGILGLRAIKNLQLNVPDDLAVVCFDDNEVFDLCTPAITAIRQPIESMARGAVKILMGEMGVAKKSARKQVKIQTSIVRRDSA